MTTPFFMAEGGHIDHFGNVIMPIFVDFRDPSHRQPVATLIKGCRQEYAIETSRRILISKSDRFRKFGENLIWDPAEAHASISDILFEAVDDPHDLDEARQHDQALDRSSELAGFPATHTTTSTRRTRTHTSSMTTGKNGWIFCTSIEPTNDSEWALWRETLESDYDHVSYIHRPREFARALGSMVAEQLGAQGNQSPLTHSFMGEVIARTNHTMQMIIHGPVIYVDDVYTLINEVASPLEKMFLPLFAKETRFSSQREYRFVIWTEMEPTRKKVLLDATPTMTGIMQEYVRELGLQVIPPADSLEHDQPLNNDQTSVDDESYDIANDDIGAPTINVVSGYEPPRTLWDLTDDQSTIFTPRRLEPNEMPDDFQALTMTYSAVKALRDKVDGPLGLAGQHPGPRLEVASAAWYAEPIIGTLCQAFPDPISGISITSDNYVVVHVSFGEWPEIECTIAVAPSGESVMNLERPGYTTSVIWQSESPRDDVRQTVERFAHAISEHSNCLERQNIDEPSP